MVKFPLVFLDDFVYNLLLSMGGPPEKMEFEPGEPTCDNGDEPMHCESNEITREDVADLIHGVELADGQFIQLEPAIGCHVAGEEFEDESVVGKGDLLEAINNARERGEPFVVKFGVDPTSSELHIGHMVLLRRLKAFLDAEGLGIKCVLIIGDFTAQIGDPTGRDTTRPALTHEQVLANAKTYLDQIGRIIDLDKLEVRYNSEWFGEMTAADVVSFFSDYTLAGVFEGRKYQLRDEKGEGIRQHELIYRLLQGKDSVEIDAGLELGGSDQRTNCLQGRDMQKLEWARQNVSGRVRQVVLLMDLLRGLDGRRKMGKSEGNAVALEDDPAEIYAALMSMPDELMSEYIDLLTGLDPEEKRVLKISIWANQADPLLVKRQIAWSVVEQLRGEDIVRAVAAGFDDEDYAPRELIVEDEENGDAREMFNSIMSMPDEWMLWYVDHMMVDVTRVAVEVAGDDGEVTKTTIPNKDRLRGMVSSEGVTVRREIASNVVGRFYGGEVADAISAEFDDGDFKPRTLEEVERDHVRDLRCCPMLEEGTDGMEVILPPPTKEELEAQRRTGLPPLNSLEGKIQRAESSGKKMRIKLRLDPIKQQLHLGHASILRRLKELQDAGHQVVIVVDDFMAGAPRRGEEGLDPGLIDKNTTLLLEQIGKILDLDEVEIHNNSEWLTGLNLSDIIQLLSGHTLQQVLGPPHNRTDLGRRYDAGDMIHLDEILLYVLNARDCHRVKSDVEIGCRSGVVRYWMGRCRQQIAGQASQLVLLPPVLPGRDGKEMSCADNSVIWMDDDSDAMFERVMRVDDRFIDRWIDVMVEGGDSVRDGFRSSFASDPLRGKKDVALNIVRQFHGRKAAAGARRTYSQKVDRAREGADAVEEISLADLELGGGLSLVSLVIAVHKHQSGEEKSSSFVRKNWIKNGAIKVSGEPVRDPRCTWDDFPEEGMTLQITKKGAVVKVTL